MKYFFLLLFLVAAKAEALPSMDKIVGLSTPANISIVRDSIDQDLFYIFPQRFGLARDSDKNYLFWIQEYKSSGSETKAYAQMTFIPYFDKGILLQAIREIKVINPNSRFSLVPVASMVFAVPKIMFPGFEQVACQANGGLLGQDINCSVLLNKMGTKLFVQRIAQNFTALFNVTYNYTGILAGKEVKFDHTVPMYVGKIPASYIYDSEGKPKGKAEKQEEPNLGESFADVQKEINLLNRLTSPSAPVEWPVFDQSRIDSILDKILNSNTKIPAPIVEPSPVCRNFNCNLNPTVDIAPRMNEEFIKVPASLSKASTEMTINRQ